MATGEENAASAESAKLNHAQKHINFLLANSPIYTHLFSSIQLLSVEQGRVFVKLSLEPHHLNSKGILHGSVSATLIDFMGGLAIACWDERMNTGVSTEMHISYIGTARAGDVLDIEGAVDKLGGTLGFTTITIRKLESGKKHGEGALLVKGSHTKFVKFGDQKKMVGQ